MYNNITKKEFINILTNSNNELLYSNLFLMDKEFTKIMDILYNVDFKVINSRKCIKVNSNSLTFNDNSKLYFNSIKRCVKHNNVIITYDEHYNIFDECYIYSVVAYVIK